MSWDNLVIEGRKQQHREQQSWDRRQRQQRWDALKRAAEAAVGGLLKLHLADAPPTAFTALGNMWEVSAATPYPEVVIRLRLAAAEPTAETWMSDPYTQDFGAFPFAVERFTREQLRDGTHRVASRHRDEWAYCRTLAEAAAAAEDAALEREAAADECDRLNKLRQPMGVPA